MDIVCIPFHDLKVAQIEGFRTRDSHLYAHFAVHKKIEKTIIVNRPTLLGELLLGRKPLKASGELIYNKNGVFITKVTDKFFCIDIIDYSFLGAILKGKGFIIDLYAKNYKSIKLALDYLCVKGYVTYESSPLTFDLCKALSPRFRIFDGVDNLCKHPTYSRQKDKLRETYKQIIKSYDSVYFNSIDSVDFFNAKEAGNVEFLANGVDFDRFQGSKVMPAFFKSATRPVAVYAGKMQDLFDVQLVRELSKAYVECTFLLLGKILKKGIKEALVDCRNVVFLGDIKYEELPSYICNADVCFIPYDVNNQHGGDPIKFYEYMAANKPVVSTAVGEISSYHNGEDIFICDRGDFVSFFGVALQCKKLINNLLPEEFTWKYKSSYMLGKVFDERECS